MGITLNQTTNAAKDSSGTPCPEPRSVPQIYLQQLAVLEGAAAAARHWVNQPWLVFTLL